MEVLASMCKLLLCVVLYVTDGDICIPHIHLSNLPNQLVLINFSLGLHLTSSLALERPTFLYLTCDLPDLLAVESDQELGVWPSR